MMTYTNSRYLTVILHLIGTQFFLQSQKKLILSVEATAIKMQAMIQRKKIHIHWNLDRKKKKKNSIFSSWSREKLHPSQSEICTPDIQEENR